MLSDIEDIFYECDKCETEIGFANNIWEIFRSKGRFVKNKMDIVIENISEKSLFVFCACCGSSSINFNEIRNEMITSCNLNKENSTLDNKPFNESVIPLEKCDFCGTGIDIGEVVVTVNCSTGKIYCNSPGHAIPDYFVNDSATICTLCQDCGENMDTSELKTILFDTVVKSPFNKRYNIDSELPGMAIVMNKRL